MPFLSILGAIWGNPWSRLVIVAVLAGGFGWVKGFNAVPRVDITAVERNAIAGRDAEWSRKLADLEEQSRLAIDAAIEVRDHTVLAPDADLLQLCAKSTACRDRK